MKLVPLGYEARTLDLARRLLGDIPPCAEADYAMRWISGAPLLVLAFHLPETMHQPACAIRLVNYSQSEPMRPGRLVEGDELRRKVRQGVEEYLAKHGVKIPEAVEP